MRTLRNILFGATISVLSVVAAYAQGGNGWSKAGPTNIAGRILAVHVDVKNDQRIYAGAAGGGFFYSPNGGKSWSRSTFNGSAAVSAIAQSNDGTIYIGTGEGFNAGLAEPGVLTNNAPYGIKGDGVYKSTNNGQTFVRLAGTENWTVVNSMAYDNQNRKLYVATNEGLKVSSDDGVTFSAVAGVSATSIAVMVRAGNDGTVIFSEFGTEGKVYVSKNGGAFTSVGGSAVPKLPTANSGRISVDIAPTDPDVMYALVSDKTGVFTGVYISKDKGTKWRLALPSGGNIDPLKNGGRYLNTMAVSQDTSNLVMLGGLALYTGMDWDTVNYPTWLPVNSVNYARSICYAKNNVAYIGTNSGVSVVANGKGSTANNLLTTSQAYTLGVGSDGRFMIGTRENGTVVVEKPNSSQKSGQSLKLVTPDEKLFADGASCVFSIIKPGAMFYTASYGHCFRQADLTSVAEEPAQWMGGWDTTTVEGKYFLRNILDRKNNKKYTRWHSSESGLVNNPVNENVSPLAIWESVEDYNTIDSVDFVADKTYAPGDKICVKSKRNAYPFWMEYTGTDTLKRENNDKWRVKDIVTSRLFIGGSGYKLVGFEMGAPVFMATNALDFIYSTPFQCIFRTSDVTEQVMSLVPSKDGEHLFILTKTSVSNQYAIYRVSGLDSYRLPKDIDVSRAVQTYGAADGDPNPDYKLTVDTLIFGYGGDDILSIALDPQDNDKLIYTTNGMFARINLIPNATTVTLETNTDIEDKEGFGLPEDIAIYDIIVEHKNHDIAYVGTEEGVYKTTNFTDATPTWDLYNNGIDGKVPVFKLYQQTNYLLDNTSVLYDSKGNIKYTGYPGVNNYGLIYAASHGLGVFTDSTYLEHIGSAVPNIPNSLTNNIRLHVFPNPVKEMLTVDFSLTATDNVNITLLDVMGRTVMSKSLGTRMIGIHSEQIDCADLAEGIYFVRINAGYLTQSAKIVIRK